MGISRILRSFPYGAYMFYSRYRMPGPSSAPLRSHNHLPLPEHSYVNRAVECSTFLCTDLLQVGEWVIDCESRTVTWLHLGMPWTLSFYLFCYNFCPDAVRARP